MANFDEIKTQFPVYQLNFADIGAGAPLTIGFGPDSGFPGPEPIDQQVKDFAEAVAALWETTVVAVTRLDVDGTVL